MSSLGIALLGDDRLFCDGVVRILLTDGGFDVTVYDTIAGLKSSGRAPADVLLIDSRLDDAFAIGGDRDVATASLLLAAVYYGARPRGIDARPFIVGPTPVVVRPRSNTAVAGDPKK